MSKIKVEQLLQPRSEEAPSGPNLEDEIAYANFESITQGKPEQQYGDTIIPAQDPDWAEVLKQGMQLLEQSMDLGVAVHTTRAAMSLEGFEGLRAGLELILGYLDQYWDTVHPQLDPEDDLDPVFRVNRLNELADLGTTIRILKNTPLVKSRMLGAFAIQHVRMARGEVPPPPDASEPPKLQVIEGAFNEVGAEAVEELSQQTGQSLESVARIESLLNEKVGADQSVNFKPLRDELEAVDRFVKEQRNRLNPESGEAEGAQATQGDEADQDDGPATPQGGRAAALEGQGASLSGQIRSRQDVIKALDKICDFYHQQEPGSPIPILLIRARHLVDKSFMQIMEDLAPDWVETLTQLRGKYANDEASEGAVEDGY